ncbi:MAG: helix-turn-helix transcriptional regulator [Oscillospiraceae bacterium]|nr:helix-turn-helix transcriptional regulator [Oscillospiraceae bacterium]
MDPFKITLEAARVNAHLTQDEAARQLHITKQTLVNWEKGRTEPTISQALKLCELYKIPIEHINFGENMI